MPISNQWIELSATRRIQPLVKMNFKEIFPIEIPSCTQGGHEEAAQNTPHFYSLNYKDEALTRNKALIYCQS